MKIAEIESLKESIQHLQKRIDSLEDVRTFESLDRFHTEMQNLVFEVQAKANRVGDGIATMLRARRSETALSAPDYVRELLSEPDEPDEPGGDQVPVNDATPDTENVEVQTKASKRGKDEPKSD